jgi:hypothetical protein
MFIRQRTSQLIKRGFSTASAAGTAEKHRNNNSRVIVAACAATLAVSTVGELLFVTLVTPISYTPRCVSGVPLPNRESETNLQILNSI